MVKDWPKVGSIPARQQHHAEPARGNGEHVARIATRVPSWPTASSPRLRSSIRPRPYASPLGSAATPGRIMDVSVGGRMMGSPPCLPSLRSHSIAARLLIEARDGSVACSEAYVTASSYRQRWPEPLDVRFWFRSFEQISRKRPSADVQPGLPKCPLLVDSGTTAFRSAYVKSRRSFMKERVGLRSIRSLAPDCFESDSGRSTNWSLLHLGTRIAPP
jgi:hypothetical protein